MSDLGKINYEAYSDASGGHAFNGEPLRTWEELDEPRRDAWRAGASAVAAVALGIDDLEEG